MDREGQNWYMEDISSNGRLKHAWLYPDLFHHFKGRTLSVLCSQQRGSLGENIVSSVFSTEGIFRGEHRQLWVRNRGGLKGRTLSALRSQQRGVLKGEHSQL